MKTTTKKTPLKGLLVIKVNFSEDERGFFIEQWNKKTFSEIGIKTNFVQDSHSSSKANVLRGLHFQNMQAPQVKLVRCTQGKVFDVAVDLRTSSKTFGKWFAIELSAKNKKQLFIPKGFGHGFAVISKYAEIQYKQSDYYTPSAEGTVLWNDPDINISWPVKKPILSERDKKGISLKKYKENPIFK